jgi:hypothetical protein
VIRQATCDRDVGGRHAAAAPASRGACHAHLSAAGSTDLRSEEHERLGGATWGQVVVPQVVSPRPRSVGARGPPPAGRSQERTGSPGPIPVLVEPPCRRQRQERTAQDHAEQAVWTSKGPVGRPGGPSGGRPGETCSGRRSRAAPRGQRTRLPRLPDQRAGRRLGRDRAWHSCYPSSLTTRRVLIGQCLLGHEDLRQGTSPDFGAYSGLRALIAKRARGWPPAARPAD